MQSSTGKLCRMTKFFTKLGTELFDLSWKLNLLVLLPTIVAVNRRRDHFGEWSQHHRGISDTIRNHIKSTTSL